MWTHSFKNMSVRNCLTTSEWNLQSSGLSHLSATEGMSSRDAKKVFIKVSDLLFSALSSFPSAYCLIVIRWLFYLHCCFQDPGIKKEGKSQRDTHQLELPPPCTPLFFKADCLRSFTQQLQLVSHLSEVLPVPQPTYKPFSLTQKLSLCPFKSIPTSIPTQD